MDKQEKNAIIKQLLDTEDDAILYQIKILLEDNNKDFWDELPQHVKDSAKQAKEELERGEGIPHDKVMAEVKSKFFKK